MDEKTYQISSLEHRPTSELDLDDPHVAAERRNPTNAERPSLRVMLAILFMTLGLMGPVMLGYAVPVSLTVPMAQSLGGLDKATWINGTWTLAGAVSFGLSGSLSDIYGRRWVTILGSVLCLIGAIIASTAQTMDALLAGSAIIGFASGMSFVAYAGIPELLPFKYRGVGLAFLEAVLAIPWALVGVLIAYRWLTIASWRISYYAAIASSAISIIGLFFCYHPPPRPQKDFAKSRWQETKELDWVGILFFVGGAVVMLLGLGWAGTAAHPWKSAPVIAPIIIGFFLLLGYLIWPLTWGPYDSFLPKRLLVRFREYSVFLILSFSGGMTYLTMLGLYPQGLLYLFTNDSVKIGIYAIPTGFGQVFGCAVLPALIHKMGNFRNQIIIGLLFQLVFTALQAWSVTAFNKYGYMFFQTLGTFSFIWVTILAMVSSGLNVNQKDLGRATGVIGAFRSIGGAVGATIFGTIITSLVNQNLGGNIAGAAFGAGLTNPAVLGALIPATVLNALGVPHAFDSVPGITPAIQAAASAAFRGTYSHAFKIMFLCTIPMNAIALICAFFVKDASPYLTNNVSIHLEDDRKHLDQEKAQEDSIADQEHDIHNK